MRGNLFTNEKQTNQIAPDETLKATTLIYLREALYNEEFEECQELIAKAKEYGADQKEIRKVITGVVRGEQATARNKVYRKRKGR